MWRHFEDELSCLAADWSSEHAAALLQSWIKLMSQCFYLSVKGAGLPVATVPRKRAAARRNCHGTDDDESDLDVMLVERLSALEDFLTRQGLNMWAVTSLPANWLKAKWTELLACLLPLCYHGNGVSTLVWWSGCLQCTLMFFWYFF